MDVPPDNARATLPRGTGIFKLVRSRVAVSGPTAPLVSTASLRLSVITCHQCVPRGASVAIGDDKLESITTPPPYTTSPNYRERSAPVPLSAPS